MKPSFSNTTQHDERIRVAESKDLSDEILARAILQLNRNICGLVFGVICGLVVFIATTGSSSREASVWGYIFSS